MDKITFTEREFRLINNCIEYHENDPAGLPGHNLMIIISKMAGILRSEGIRLELEREG